MLNVVIVYQIPIIMLTISIAQWADASSFVPPIAFKNIEDMNCAMNVGVNYLRPTLIVHVVAVTNIVFVEAIVIINTGSGIIHNLNRLLT